MLAARHSDARAVLGMSREAPPDVLRILQFIECRHGLLLTPDEGSFRDFPLGTGLPWSGVARSALPGLVFMAGGPGRNLEVSCAANEVRGRGGLPEIGGRSEFCTSYHQFRSSLGILTK